LAKPNNKPRSGYKIRVNSRNSRTKKQNGVSHISQEVANLLPRKSILTAKKNETTKRALKIENFIKIKTF
jgi:hypothetical protein